MNYKHLYYFWVVAKEGSIVKATEKLHLTPQTISGQINQLEQYYEVSLFNKVGRRLQLSELGQQVFNYADDIFSRGNELEQLLQHPDDRLKTFKVGIVDVIPKTIAHQILLPAIQNQANVRMECREGELEHLLAALAIHQLDCVIAEKSIPETVSMKGVSQKLGQSAVSFFATEDLAAKLNDEFPTSLNEAPLLLPNSRSQSYSSMEQWLSALKIKPKVVAQFDDSALMKAFGREGVGVFPAPSVLKKEIERQYQVVEIGKTNDWLEAYYVIYIQKRENTKLVEEIIAAADQSLFAD